MKALIYLCLLALLGCGAYLALVPAKSGSDEFADVPANPGSPIYPKPFWGHYTSDRAANLASIRNCVTLTPKERKEFSELIEEKWNTIRVTPNSFQEESEKFRETMDLSLVSASNQVLVIEGDKAKAERSVRNMVRETVTLDPRGLWIEFDAVPGLHLHYTRVR